MKTPARRKTASSGALLFAFSIVMALAWGWTHRGLYFNAESGAGYYLGILGALAMLALLAYPLRKHAAFMRGAGSVAIWFRAHMALGLIGPTLILYHANFKLGSLNSNVALWAMLIVAGSGIVGRYFYAKIHRGLYGERAAMRELQEEAVLFRMSLSGDFAPDLAKRIEALELEAFTEAPGMFAAAGKAFAITARARRLRAAAQSRLKRDMRAARADEEARRKLRAHIDFCARYFRRIEQAAELSFYERLFAAWHVLHLPLFILLIITAIIHVVAVHLY